MIVMHRWRNVAQLEGGLSDEKGMHRGRTVEYDLPASTTGMTKPPCFVCQYISMHR